LINKVVGQWLFRIIILHIQSCETSIPNRPGHLINLDSNQHFHSSKTKILITMKTCFTADISRISAHCSIEPLGNGACNVTPGSSISSTYRLFSFFMLFASQKRCWQSDR
jgi:hypothetical protein